MIDVFFFNFRLCPSSRPLKFPFWVLHRLLLNNKHLTIYFEALSVTVCHHGDFGAGAKLVFQHNFFLNTVSRLNGEQCSGSLAVTDPVSLFSPDVSQSLTGTHTSAMLRPPAREVSPLPTLGKESNLYLHSTFCIEFRRPKPFPRHTYGCIL